MKALMLVVATTLLSAQICQGQIDYYVNFVDQFQQTQDGVISASTEVGLLPQIIGLISSSDTASVTLPDGSIYQLVSQYGSDVWSPVGLVGYINPSTGNGTYTFSIEDSLNRTVAQNSVVASENFPDPLMLVGDSFENLEQTPTDQPITINFNSITFDPSASYSALGILGVGSLPITLAAGTTSYTFAANTFQPGTTYTFSVSSYQDYFSTQTQHVDYGNGTFITFTAAAPEPPVIFMLEMSGLLVVGAGGVSRTFKSRAGVT